MTWHERTCNGCGQRVAARTDDPAVQVLCTTCDPSDLPLSPAGAIRPDMRAASTWEARMAARAAARASAGPLEPIQACQIGDPDLPDDHRGHHRHVLINSTLCSCGADLGDGCWSVALPDWTEQQWADWEATRRCSICGAAGVVAWQDYLPAVAP